MLRKLFARSWMDPEFTRKKRFLQRVSFFKNIPDHEFGRLFQILAVRHYLEGEVLFKEGDVGRALFILETGQVEILRQGLAGRQERLAVLGPGDYFGEMSLLDDLPRTATTRALAPCRVYLLYKAQLDTLLQNTPRLGGAIMAHLAELLAGRLRLLIDRTRSETTKAIVPLHEEVL